MSVNLGKNLIGQWVSANLEDISSDKVLRWFGFFLALALIFNWLFWEFGSGFRILTDPDSERTCWPWAFMCADQTKSLATLNLVAAYGLIATSVLAAFGFALNRIPMGFWALAAAFAIKLLLFFQDYRLAGNYHLMQHWLLFGFLFLPNKKSTLAILTVLFYFWAGTLKLNLEWMSGSALLRQPLIHETVMSFLLGGVIVLELCGSWFLLYRSSAIFWSAFAGFVFFHLFSILVVGFYYPSQMFCFLMLFVLARLIPGSEIQPDKLSKSGIAFLALFSFLQIIPWAHTGDTALTSNGRVVSLNMLDVMPQCQPLAYVRSEGQTIEVNLLDATSAPRIACDPVFYRAKLKNLCRSFNPGTRVDFVLASKRQTDTAYSNIASVTDVCSQELSYSLLGFNPWLRQIPGRGRAPDLFVTQSLHLSTSQTDDTTKRAASQVSQYRGGPERNGQFAWPLPSPFAPRKIWERPNGNEGVHGASKTSPVVHGNSVIIAGDTGWLFHYDLDGQLKWRFFFSAPQAGIHSTPAIADDTVYVATYAGRLYALDLDSGRLKWVAILGDAIGASPLVLGPHVYVSVELATDDGFFVKLDRETGEVLWKSPHFGAQGHSSPAYHESSDAIIAGSNTGKLHAVKASDGSLIWETKVGGEIKSTPLIVGDDVYVTSWRGSLDRISAKDGTILASYFVAGRIMGSPAYLPQRDQVVFAAGRGRIISVDKETLEHKWTFEKEGTGHRASVSVFSDGSLTVACGRTSLCLLRGNGQLAAELPIDALVENEVVIHGRSIFVSANHPGGLSRWDF
jgi:outer membrane protein assembly factor BamB